MFTDTAIRNAKPRERPYKLGDSRGLYLLVTLSGGKWWRFDYGRGQKGMVQIWDVVGFDEIVDFQKMPKEVITTMKTFCESGTFQRGHEAASGDASIALFGNTNQPVDVMVQTGHLFAPMPDVIRDDMAFIDRCTSTSRAGRSRRCGTTSSRITSGSS
jgi:hypothetical protein